MVDDSAAESGTAREEEDDHDLLTFGEAGARLSGEVAELVARVRKLEAEGGAGEEELDDARGRLADLRAAAERNARHPINDANFARFFGYEGTARQNIP
ncbi:hypothetical protein [Tomitella biformata]|uniref:hypothetical protein n=1 Tax=Tomitella biformata TaxID=630403 RepID=UPI0004655CDC|nr:hypothetical protein [Tomitella biformata]